MRLLKSKVASAERHAPVPKSCPRRQRRRRAVGCLLIGGLAGVLAGCSGLELAETGAAAAGVAASQERGFRQSAIDTGIQLQVGSRLLQENVDLFGKVNNTCVMGRVLLTGSVPTPADRETAEQLARSVPGVRQVLNEIQVQPETDIADYGRDAWISAKLRTNLLTDEYIVNINYWVTTVNGIVYLYGIAQNQAEVDRAIDYARSIAGVRQVVNHVMLKSELRRQP